MPAPRKDSFRQSSEGKKRRALRANAAKPITNRGPVPWLGVFGIVTLTLAAYWPAFHAGYIWDDADHVTQVPFQRTLTALKWVWFKLGTTPQYYPLTHTTFWLEYRLWGMNPLGYHTVNIVLHISCALLVWRVLQRLNIGGAWLVAAIFAVHPVHVESVAWITERKNTLSALFYLLAMLAGLRALMISVPPVPSPADAERTETAGEGTGGTFGGAVAWPYALCLLFFIAAVLSKTVTCTLPAALVLILWWKHGRVAKRDWLMLTPLFAIALGVAKLTSGMERWNVGAKGPEFAFTFAQRVLIAGRAIWFYAGKLLWPHPLIFIYPRWNIDAHMVWQWIFPVGVVLVVAALWMLRKRIGRGPLVAVLFFIGTLFPALGFVDVYPMRFSFVADHFQYLASIGLLVLLVQMLRNIAKLPGSVGVGSAPRTMDASAEVSVHSADPTRLIILSAVILTVLAGTSFIQARAYKDAATLWRDTWEKNPDCWLAMDNLGAEAAQHGDRADAFTWYDRSLKAHQNQAEAHLSRGELLAGSQPPRFDEAAREFAAAAKIRPDDAHPIYELARLFLAEGKFAAALEAYEKTLAMEPHLEPARLEYANLLRTIGPPRYADAEAQYQKAIELNPDSFDARSALAGMHYLARDIPGALQLMAEAVDINPSDPALCNNYGVFLMAANRPAEAAKQFNNAIETDPTFVDAYDGLGNALLVQGKPGEAEKMFHKALELKPDFEAAREHLAAMQGH